LSNENVTSIYDDRLDKLDPEGTLQPGQRRNTGTSDGGTSPRDSTSPSPMRDQQGQGSKKAQLMAKVSIFSQAVSQKVDQAKDKADALKYQGTLNRKRCFTLLIIANPNIDWQKWFRGRKIHTDWDIRVEQCQFSDLAITANTEEGISVGLVTLKNGQRSVDLLKPDFLLIRQDPRDAGEDFKSALVGFQYGQVPSINSLESVYNFQDKPWVYAHLLALQKKLGKENFPLMEQSFFQNHKDIAWEGGFPCVFKIGHAHGGQGKVKVENEAALEDIKGVVAVSNQYCTIEKFVEAYCDLHIFKIGSTYKALMRKSLSGNWKTNVGDVEIKEVTIQEKYKKWIDEASSMFGGLELCSLEAIVDGAGQEYIIEINDCAMGLMGDGQDEDRKLIAEVVIKEMEAKCKVPVMEKPPAPLSDVANDSRPDSVQSTVSSDKRKMSVSENGAKEDKEEKKEVKKKERSSEGEEKSKKEHKRDRSEEKARKAEKEARRAEKEAKRERERRKEEERQRKEREEEERRKEEERKKAEEERRKKMQRDDSDESEPSVISRQPTKDSEDSESDSDSVSESSNASSTIEKKTKAVAKPKIKDVEVPDTMKDMQATFSGIFGEKNKI